MIGEGGAKIGGKSISNLRYADNTTLIANSEEEIADLHCRLQRDSRILRLEMNKAKTKIMMVDQNALSNLKVVHGLIYIGLTLLNDGGRETEIKHRIGMAKSSMSKLSKISKDQSITVSTKMRLVFPVFLYGRCELEKGRE
ncbi:uncharacterized protein LOC143909123 [Arctopsyche grandis]|uniref:uncharacterized protein LOC143909123 n=1 Tax=Arctopsyche grandis TaxID=121162 RepID=UPI00406D938B